MNRYAKTKFIAGGVLLLAASGAARADTIYLSCGGFPHTIDTAANTFDNHPATINATAVDSRTTGTPQNDNNAGDTFESNVHIDRVTGTYTLNTTVRLANGQVLQIPPTVLPCSAGAAPATKF